MSITTLAQVKLLNNITSTDYDTIIEAQIPIVQDIIHEYTGNSFISTTEEIVNKQNGSNALDFGYEIYDSANVYASGDFIVYNITKTITANSDSFKDFIAGDTIAIYSSWRNNGYYTIETVTDTVITVVENTLSSADEYMGIYMIVYPKSVSAIAARMVGWDVLKRNKSQGISDENVGTYSVKYRNISGLDYPQDIVSGLKKHHTGA